MEQRQRIIRARHLAAIGTLQLRRLAVAGWGTRPVAARLGWNPRRVERLRDGSPCMRLNEEELRELDELAAALLCEKPPRPWAPKKLAKEKGWELLT